MLTLKKWNVQISVFVQGGPKASGVWILVPFQKFWVRHILKPKLPLLAYKALGVWFLTSLSTLHSHHVPPSSGPLALYLSSSVQSRMPSCALSLPQSSWGCLLLIFLISVPILPPQRGHSDLSPKEPLRQSLLVLFPCFIFITFLLSEIICCMCLIINCLLWAKCLCSPKIRMLKPYSPRWWYLEMGLGELIMSWGV